MRADSVTAARARSVWRSAADRVPSFVVARLLYAASAWWRFHHGRRPAAHWRISTLRCACRFRRANDPTAIQLVEDSDDQLFHRVRYGHVLQPLIADRRTNSSPTRRDRRHHLQLTCRQSATTDCNFITWQLFKDAYWFYSLIFILCYILISVYGSMSFLCSLLSGPIFILVVFCFFGVTFRSCGLSCFLLNECVLLKYQKAKWRQKTVHWYRMVFRVTWLQNPLCL